MRRNTIGFGEDRKGEKEKVLGGQKLKEREEESIFFRYCGKGGKEQEG